MANEYANLEGLSTLGAGQTKLGEKTLNLTTTLDDIGESRYVYVIPQSGSTRFDLVTSNVYGKDQNKTWESTEKKDISTDAKFSAEAGMSRVTATEQYVNFGNGFDWTSDWRIRYEVTIDITNTPNWSGAAISGETAGSDSHINRLIRTYQGGFSLPEYEAGAVISPTGFVTNVKDNDGVYTVSLDVNDKDVVTKIVYSKDFAIKADINPTHQKNIKEVFNIADRNVSNIQNGQVITNLGYTTGEVYVGTTSLEDVSDKMSYQQFLDTYTTSDDMDTIKGNEYGNWVKAIDNDNDGEAEYVFKVIYSFAQVVSVDADGKATLSTKGQSLSNHSLNGSSADEINTLASEPVVCADELATGNVVYYALIDGKAQTYVPEMVTAKFDKIDRNAKTTTTTEDVTYNEGAVCNHTFNNTIESGVAQLSSVYTYDVYLTRGGHLGVFTHNPTSTWTLLTDGWYNQQRGGVEYAALVYNNESKLQVDTTITSGGSLFIGTNNNILNNNWNAMKALNNINNTEANWNGVRSALAFLSADGALVPADRVYSNSNKIVRVIDMNKTIPNKASDFWGDAYYTSLAATQAYDNQEVYDASNLSNGARQSDNKVELRALSSTVYYYVYKNTANDYVVDVYTGYGSAPSVAASSIEDVYAVASRTGRASTLVNGSVYYTAEAVVVELNGAYKQRGEQIFVYDIPVVSNAIQRETINYIDSKGAVQTAEIDLSRSTLRNYLPGYGKTIQPGLYYLYPTTTEGLYTVETMTPADIAKNNYAIGQSATQNGISWNNYIEIQTWNKDAAATDGSQHATTAGEVKDPTPEYALNSSSGVYRLSYTNNAASSTVQPYGNYLAKLDTCEYGSPLLGEFVGEQVNRANTPISITAQYDHQNPWWNNNDLLIAYSGSTILYVISFENFTSTGGVNYAQTVWNSLIPPLANVTANGVSFYGNAVTGKTASVDYYETVWNTPEKDAHTIVVTPGENRTIDSVTVVEKAIGGNVVKEYTPQYSQTRYEFSITPSTEGRVYDVTVVYARPNGTYDSELYTLTQNAAGTDSALRYKGNALGGNVITVPNQPSENVEKWLADFTATNKGSIEWTMTIDGVTKTFNSREAVPPEFAGRQTDSIVKLTAVVFAENGSAVAGQTYANNADNVLAAKKEAAKKALGNVDGYEQYKDNPSVKAAYDTAVAAINNANTQTIDTVIAAQLTSLKNAIAAAKNTTLKLGAAPFTNNCITGLTVDGVNYAANSSIEVKDGEITLGFTHAANGDTLIFTATQGAQKIIKTVNCPIADGTPTTSYTVTLDGLNGGEWELTVAKQAAAAELSFKAVGATSADASVQINGEGANMLNGGTIKVNANEEVIFTVTSPDGYQVASVKAGDNAVPYADGKYTYTQPNSADDVAITVTFEQIAVFEEAKNELQGAAQILNGLKVIGANANTKFTAALNSLNAAATKAEVDAAEAALVEALGLSGGTVLMEIPTTGDEETDCILSSGMVLAYDSDANDVTEGDSQKRWTLYGTPKGGFTSTSELTDAQTKALKALWYGDESYNDDKILETMFKAIKSGGSNGEWSGVAQTDREKVESFHWILLPTTNGEGQESYVALMFCVTSEGKYFTDEKGNWPKRVNVVTDLTAAGREPVEESVN